MTQPDPDAAAGPEQVTEAAPPAGETPAPAPVCEPVVAIPVPRPVLPLARRRGLLLRVGLGLAAVFVMLGGPAVLAYGGGWQEQQSPPRSAEPLRAASSTVSQDREPVAAAHAARASRTRARPGHLHTSRPVAVRTRLQSVLDTQAAALLRGDQAAFLAPADQHNAALMGDLRRRYGVLRALQVRGWTEQLAADPQPVSGGWQATVKLGYCFVVAGCRPVAVPVQTRWADGGERPVLTAFGSSEAIDLGPRPWEVSDLTVAVGARTIVAAPPQYADRMTALLASAEKAAAVADRYAKWGPPPARYLVYLAGPDEWGHWYGVHQADWVAGYAMPITDHDTEIVLNAQRVTPAEAEDTLRHEFAHVVTLVDVKRDYSGQWWLVEGMAEYVRMAGRPLDDYELLAPTRRYASGNAVDVAGLAEPAASASTEDASGRYGVAFLTVRSLADRFGEPAMLRFFDDVVRKGVPEEQAATADLGADWSDVSTGCSRYVQRNLH